MAIIYSKHDCRIGLFEQTVWGTGAVNGDSIYEIANVPVGIDPDGRMRRPPRGYSSNDSGAKTGQRVADIRDLTNDRKGAAPTIALPAHDARKGDLAHSLHGLFQNCDEGGTTPYIKAFKFGETQPDFPEIDALTDTGSIYSVCIEHPLGGTDQMIRDCIVRDLALSLAPDAGDGRLQVQETYMGRGPLVDTLTYSGTWTRQEESFFYFHDLGGFTLDALNGVLMSFNLNLSNNATPTGVKVGSDGDFYTFAMNYTGTGSFRVAFDAVYAALLAPINDGSANHQTITMYWGNSTPSADGDLKFVINLLINKGTVVYEDVQAIDFEFEIATDRDNDVDDVVVISLADAIDRGWTV